MVLALGVRCTKNKRLGLSGGAGYFSSFGDGAGTLRFNCCAFMLAVFTSNNPVIDKNSNNDFNCGSAKTMQ